MPPYTRFLKDLCITKTSTNVLEKAFLAFGANFIISHQILVKYKDLTCPTFSIIIGDQFIHRVLLDLRARVNLIPFTEYDRPGLSELKPSKMVI